MRLKRKAFLIGLVCMLIGTGCSLTQPPQTYMRLPKLMAEEEKLMEQLQVSLPPGAAIIKPRKLNQRNTVPILDLNGDGTEEAVIFYKDKGDKNQIIGQLWSRKQEGWKLLQTIQGEGNELDTLTFVDLMHNGSPVIIVGYSSVSNRDQKGLTLYSLSREGQLQKQFESPYQELIIDDMNEDSKVDMTVITRVRGKDKDTASATLYQYEGSFLEKGKTPLDPYVNGYYNVMSGQVSANKRGVILDAGVGAHSSLSQILIWDNGQLRAVFSDKDNPTFRAYSALSTDVNRDQIIEIPLMITPPGWEKAAMVEIPWIIQYFNWDGEAGLSYVLERYMDNTRGFYIDIPKSWSGKYTLEKTDTSVRFMTTAEKALLAEIRFVPVEQWKGDQVDTLVELTRTATTVFTINKGAVDSDKSFFHLVTETIDQGEDNPS